MRKDYNLEKRKYVIGGFVVVLVCIYIVRLFMLQIMDDSYKDKSDGNAYVHKIIYPSRGLIFDRKGKLIVFNQPSYDVTVILKDVQPFDTVDFCNTLQITRQEFDERMEKVKETKRFYSEQVFLAHINQEDYGRIQEKLYRFPGFSLVQRIMRDYTQPVGAGFLGDIREVNAKEVETDDYYNPGDYIGDMGLEKEYESYLRGVKGEEILIRDHVGRIKGHYDEGRHDIKPQAGHNLTLGIDIELQAYGEQLMKGKRGAIVAIEPATGEILALVTSPTYDPRLLVGKDRGKNYAALFRDPEKPTYNRAIQAAYPPGSTFKPSQGLILQQEGIITTSTMYPCTGGYVVKGLRVGCHGHAAPLNLKPALTTSCNAFFCWGLNHMLNNKKYGGTEKAFEVWKNHLVKMGYGKKLGIDLPFEGRGFLPNSKYYNEHIRGKWNANSIISVAIGQGEILATPLQIANLCALIANRGYFYTPHMVKRIEGVGVLKRFTTKRIPSIDAKYYQEVVAGMRGAVLSGTCRKANLEGIEVCGKTGTAQNPHGRDHSAFMGFAPMNNPKIAIAVYVENGGFGAEFGVPIGSLMMEKYLTGEVKRKDMESNMMNSRIAKQK